MISTTYEWQMVVLMTDGSTYTSVPTQHRAEAVHAAKFWREEPEVAGVSVIKRTITSEEETI